MSHVTIKMYFIKKGIIKMEELKRMLKAIHEENKDILLLLCYGDGIEEQTEENFKEISSEIDKKYDELFYGKEGKTSANG